MRFEKFRQGTTMTKTILTAIICAFTTTTAVFGQHQQSITFSGPAEWTPGAKVTLDVFLTINYEADGLAYWLEVPNALAPFITITNIVSPPNGPPPYPIRFNSTSGASSGYMLETYGLGEPVGPPEIPPGTHLVNTITFSLAAGAPLGAYSLLTTSHSPRISEVSDSDFNDNNIIPPGMFVINVVPEPGTLALLSVTVVGSGVLSCRRRTAKQDPTKTRR
jgi:PEP-CTERM motif